MLSLLTLGTRGRHVHVQKLSICCASALNIFISFQIEKRSKCNKSSTLNTQIKEIVQNILFLLYNSQTTINSTHTGQQNNILQSTRDIFFSQTEFIWSHIYLTGPLVLKIKTTKIAIL